MSGRAVEDIYQKKTQHEHILTRPDMYIGTIEPVTDDVWVYDEAEKIMKIRKCTWIPGLYKIFDEILVNAADNKVRDPDRQTFIKVWIDASRGMVRIRNNGEGIPIQKHREHNLWIPEMIFGHLLTSSNYDDSEAKVTGGRNGYGAKLTNVFSTRFEVKTVHGRSRKKFHMKWTNNMLQHSEPEITPSDGAEDYTEVTFYPDFAKFNVTEFSEDMVLMMKRRVYDAAGCTDKSLRCYLNDEKLEVKNFVEYVDLYPTMGEEKKSASYSRVNDRWEVCVRVSNMGFQQISFVNSIATLRGGTHVKYITDQIISKVTDQAKKRSKVDAKPHMIRPHLFVFINALIENPGFDSQTKETLNTTRAKFGSSCELPQSMIDYILKSGIVERTVEMANSKLTKEMAAKLRSSDRKQILGIPKLDDANEAGGKNGHRCTLIVTEGDSAKTLCTAGLAVKNRDYFGVFPLRGKPLNVRDATLKKVMACEEIQSVMKIMGLDIRQKHASVEGLRYGHLMIMSDQDHDGSHIKGLIVNFIHHYWPDLIRVPGFLQQFITPIVKARKKGRRSGSDEDKAISFFSMPDYFQWKQQIGDRIRDYEVRYYKGLGTSGAAEGREYFENIDRHRLDFVYHGTADEDRIRMAFAKDKVDDRKQWITTFKTNENVNESVDYTIKKITYSDFIDKELILFSVADCERSIPSVIDGLKPGQRKILFSSFKRNLVRSIKVVQLAGYVSEHSAYHHGENSLVQTIVALAQDFVGSNNVPLMHKDGQFGTRLHGGKDHAAGRYIFTRLDAIARLIYHPSDDFIVDYRDDDGLSVEPFYYVPVIPMVLVNGTSGIGTGFSTSIPNYSPFDIIQNIRRMLRGEEQLPLKPWYFGFTGVIEEKEKGKYQSYGKINVRSDGVVCVTELPINTWTQNYKKFLEDLMTKEAIIQYREYNTDVTIDFEILLHPQILRMWQSQDCLLDKLQLREYVHATNIIAFNKDGQITKYADAENVVKEFFVIRLDYYNRRKDYLLGELRRTASRLENMVRFVSEVVEGTLIITKRKKKDLLEEVRRRGYAPFPPQQKKKVSATTIEGEGEEEEAPAANEDEATRIINEALNEVESPEVMRATKDYDYLLGMRLWSLTAEVIARLQAQLQRARDDLSTLQKQSPEELWVTDLDIVEAKLQKYYDDRLKEIISVQKRKAEKKRPFDVSRIRVPLLSDKTRLALEREIAKQEKRAGTGARTAENGDGDEENEGGAPRPRAPAKAAARRKRKRRNSDDDDDDDDNDSDMDEAWLFGEDDGSGSGDGSGSDAPPKRAARTTAKAPRTKTSSSTTTATATAPRRSRAKATVASSGAKTETTDVDIFDLDGFGLDALSGTTSGAATTGTTTTTKTTTTRAPHIASATGSSNNNNSNNNYNNIDDDDDLALLGMKPTAAAAAAAPAKRTTTTTTTTTTTSSSAPSAPSRRTATNAPAKRAARKKKGANSSSDDDDSDNDSSSSSGSGSGSGSDSDAIASDSDESNSSSSSESEASENDDFSD